MSAPAPPRHSAALETALAYAAQGLRVHPVDPITKAPKTKYGHLDGTTNPDTIRQWWTVWPAAGIGVALAASGLVDVAPDSPAHLAAFEQRGLPAAAAFTSPGGAGHVHHLFRRPAGCPTTRICRSGEYDILSDGYAILPNGDGSRVWLTLAPNLNGGLPDAPVWVVEMLREHTARRTAVTTPSVQATAADEPPVELAGEDLAVWRGERPKLTPDGRIDRSASLLKIGRVLYDAGMTRRGVVAELRERDDSLGWRKYCERPDGAIRYAEIMDELERSGRTPATDGPAPGDRAHRPTIAPSDELEELRAVNRAIVAVLRNEAKPAAKVAAIALALEVHSSRPDDLISLPAVAKRTNISDDVLSDVLEAHAGEDGAFVKTTRYERANPWTGEITAEPHPYVRVVPAAAHLSLTLDALAECIPDSLRKKKRARTKRPPFPELTVDDVPACPTDATRLHTTAVEEARIARCRDCGLPLAVKTREGAVLTLPRPELSGVGNGHHHGRWYTYQPELSVVGRPGAPP
jgi:hypothetical protein